MWYSAGIKSIKLHVLKRAPMSKPRKARLVDTTTFFAMFIIKHVEATSTLPTDVILIFIQHLRSKFCCRENFCVELLLSLFRLRLRNV